MNGVKIKVWKKLENGPYLVSNFGEVKSIDRISQFRNRWGAICDRKQKGVLLKPKIDNGYYRLTLYIGGVKTSQSVHRLVAETFLKRDKKRLHVNHKDGDKLNNHVDNLEWCTPSENIVHSLDNNLQKSCGEDSQFSKLTEKDVLKILEFLRLNYSNQEIIKLMEKEGVFIGRLAISRINSGKTWKRFTITHVSRFPIRKKVYKNQNCYV